MVSNPLQVLGTLFTNVTLERILFPCGVEGGLHFVNRNIPVGKC